MDRTFIFMEVRIYETTATNVSQLWAVSSGIERTL